MKSESPTKSPLAQRCCLLCKNEEKKLLNINKTILFSIIGQEVSKYVYYYDKICRRCTNILNKIEEFREYAVKVVLESKTDENYMTSTTTKPHLFTLFNCNEKRFERDEEISTPGLLTPVKSIYVTESSEYNGWKYFKQGNYGLCQISKPLEDLFLQFKIAGNHDDSAHSDQTSDNEVEHYMDRTYSKSRMYSQQQRSRSRKRRGHNWTRVKQKGQSRSRSRSKSRKSQSRCTSKFSVAYSTDSNNSIYSNITMEELELRPRTRTTSSILEDKMKASLQYDRVLFKCEESGCDENYDDTEYVDNNDELKITYGIDKLTTHLVNVHNKLALFWCKECNKRYTKQEHLTKHEESHHALFTICPYCQLCCDSVQEVQQHINQHFKYYVPCNYCDLQFLEKTVLEGHMKIVHGDRKKRVRPVKAKILFRLNKDSDDNSSTKDLQKKEPKKGRTGKSKRRRHATANSPSILPKLNDTVSTALDENMHSTEMFNKNSPQLKKKTCTFMYFKDNEPRKFGEYKTNSDANKIREETEMVNYRKTSPVQLPPPELEPQHLSDVEEYAKESLIDIDED